MATGISSPLALSGLYPSVDGSYVAANGKPFTSVSNAESALNGFPSKLSESCVGLTVLVKESGWTEAKEYWVQPKGTTPETYGLVEKGTTDYNDLDNKPTIGDGTNTALPIVGNVKVTASTALGETAGVTVTPGQTTGEIEMNFTLPKGADGADGQDGQDAVNPFKGYYPTGVSKPATGAVGDYLYAPPSDEQSTATATIWYYDSTQTPPWTDTGIDVSAVVGVEFGSGQSVSATKIKNENGEEVQGSSDVLSAEAGILMKEEQNGHNVLLEILDVDASSLSYIPYGVVDFGVKPNYELPEGTTQLYIKSMSYRTYNSRFNLNIVNQNGTAIASFATTLDDQVHGNVELTLGAFTIVINAEWSRSKGDTYDVNMDFGTTMPINVDKLKRTNYSKLLEENAISKSASTLFVCYTAASTLAKTISYSTFQLPEGSTASNPTFLGGDCGKIKMVHAHTATSGTVTLNIANTGAYPLMYHGAPVTNENTWGDNEVVEVYFDGTNYYCNSVTPKQDPSATDFEGTNGSISGTHGLVPAPTAAQKDYVLSANGGFVRNDGYFVNEISSVSVNGERTKDYTINAGSKIAVKVTSVTGTFGQWNLSWIKSGSIESVLTALPSGYMTDILEVPQDATGIRIYINIYASGNSSKIEVVNAANINYHSKKIENAGGIQFLEDRKILTIDYHATVSSSGQTIFESKEAKNYNYTGTLYARIVCDYRMFDASKYIRFSYSTGQTDVKKIDIRDRNVFKLWQNHQLTQITIAGNSILTEGDIHIELFSNDVATEINMHPLYRKRVMCFGDSLTEFGDRPYSSYLEELSGATVLNVGNGGSRYAPRSTPSLNPADRQEAIAAFDICALVEAWCDNDFSYQDAAINSGLLNDEDLNRYNKSLPILKNNPISTIDIVTLMAGANDYRNNVGLGTQTLGNFDKTTEFGAINSIVKKISETNPAIRIYGSTQCILMYSTTHTLANSSDVVIYDDGAGHQAVDNLLFPEFGDGIIKCFEMNHVPVYDMYRNIGFNAYNFDEYYSYVQNGVIKYDDTHPRSGFYRIAEKLYKFLLSK